MSANPHSYSEMEPILRSVCLICFQLTEKNIVVPSDAPEKLFINCDKYLHSTLTKGTLTDIEVHNEHQVPVCKSCFDSALELTHLSEQLTTIQKDISDLTVAFSMAVFHRRSRVYSIGQSCKTSSIVEFNEACLPPNLFSMKLGDQDIQPNKNNQEIDINGLHLQYDISNVKCEASDIQFDNLSGNPQQSVANDDIEIQISKENLDKQCGQSTIEQNQNLGSVIEMRIVHVTGENDSKKCADPNNGVKLPMSDLLKSVKMPKIILERIKTMSHKLDVSVGNSNVIKCESRQENLDETLFKDYEFSVRSVSPKSSEDGMLLKCFYCEKTFAQECHRTLHHKSHTVDKICKRSLGKQKFVYRSNPKICQITPTGKKPLFKCSYCEKKFYNPSSLKTHERTHTGERPFKCSFCNSRFKQRFHLQRHERIHTGEKNYKRSLGKQKLSFRSNQKIFQKTPTGKITFLKCSYCEKVFDTPSSLRVHERTHTGEKPFKCSFCNSRFKQRGHLQRHERIHTGEKPFKCLLCNNRYNQLTSLKCHERTHTGEKPFKCSFCNKRFKQRNHMKRHERLHTGEKPFKCSFCNNHFSRLEYHERKCHREQLSSLISQIGTQNDDSLAHLKHQEKMHSTNSVEFKCSFCEMTFSHDEERANHEKTHRREHEIENDNLIVGI